MRVTIPFRPFFRTPMLTGVKTMTCRTKRMGSVGDTFEAFWVTFELTHVMRMRLGDVFTDCFRQEGCTSAQELKDVWKAIHPRAEIDENRIVWAHCFAERRSGETRCLVRDHAGPG